MVHSMNYHLTDVQHWVDRLEKLNRRISQDQALLQQHADVAKAQIKTSIAKEIDVLKTRENWLSSHVDEIKSLKEEALTNQNDEILSMISDLKEFTQLVMCEQEVDKGEYNALLEKISGLHLMPAEDNYIGFTADPSNLEEAIINFGSLEMKEKDDDLFEVVQLCNSQNEHESDTSDINSFTWLAPQDTPDTACASDNKQTTNSVAQQMVSQYFNEIQSSSWKMWKHLEQKSVSKYMESEGRLHFPQIASDPKDWLTSKETKQFDGGSDIEKDVSSSVVGAFSSCKIDTCDWLSQPDNHSGPPQNTNILKFKQLADGPLLQWRKSEKRESCEKKYNVQNSACSQWWSSGNGTGKSESSDTYSQTSSLSTTSKMPEVMKGIQDTQPPDFSWFSRSTRWSQSKKQNISLETFSEIQKTPVEHWLYHKPEEFISKPDLCMWLAKSSQERCADCPGNCSFDLFETIKEHSAVSQKQLWLAKGSDW